MKKFKIIALLVTALTVVIVPISVFLWNALTVYFMDNSLCDNVVTSTETYYKADFQKKFGETEMNLDSRQILNNTTDSQFIVYLDIWDRREHDGDHMEINTVFETFISMGDRIINENIVAIACHYSSGEHSTFIIITANELNEIYNLVQKDQMSETALTDEMAKFWINRYHYNQPRLDITPENGYRKNLLTSFRRGVYNNSKDFHLLYSYPLGLSVTSVHRTEHSTRHSPLFDLRDFREEGHLYGAWDDNDNFWLYGETLGLMLFEFDGYSNWEQADYVDEGQMPYALTMVLETIK